MKPRIIELGAGVGEGRFHRNYYVEYSQEAVNNHRSKYANTDVYISAYSYDNKNLKTALLWGNLYFDFDGISAKEDISQAVDFLMGWGCPSSSMRVYFSGNKGFHLEVIVEALGIKPHKSLNLVYGNLAKFMKGKLEAPSLDEAIYDNRRLWRLENSINRKSGLYKIPLALPELAFDMDEIRELAHQPREWQEVPVIKSWEGFSELVAASTVKTESNRDSREGIFQPVAEGVRNNTTFERARRLRDGQVPLEQAIQICGEIEDNPKQSKETVIATVKSAYKGKKSWKRPEKNEDSQFCTSVVDYNRILYEQVIGEDGKSRFCFWNGKQIQYTDYVMVNGKVYLPDESDIIRKRTVKLARRPIEYVDESEIINDIGNLTRRYADVEKPEFVLLPYYPLVSWLYDKLSVCPYLFVYGPSDSGKTRLVQVIGNLCYRPFFTSGSITASPLFRIIDAYKPTLIINEFDHLAGIKDEITTILNCGYEPNFPVTRTVGDKELRPEVFQVFGPKIMSSRAVDGDWAFISRLITVKMKETNREDIPPFLDDNFYDEAEVVAGKLLTMRLKRFGNEVRYPVKKFAGIKGRLGQTLLSLAGVINEEPFHNLLLDYGLKREKELRQLRLVDFEGNVFMAILTSVKQGDATPLLKDLVQNVNQISGEVNISSRRIKQVLTGDFGMMVNRSGPRGENRILINLNKLKHLCLKYGVDIPDELETFIALSGEEQ